VTEPESHPPFAAPSTHEPVTADASPAGAITEPAPTEPMSTEPTSTEPTSTEPTSTEPTSTEPTSTEPALAAPGPAILAAPPPDDGGPATFAADPTPAALFGEPAPPVLAAPVSDEPTVPGLPEERPAAPVQRAATPAVPDELPASPSTQVPLAAPTPADVRSTRRGLVVGLVALLVLGLIVGVALGGKALSDARSDRADLAAADDAREEAMAAARSFAVRLTSYDYRHIDEDVAAVSAGAGDSSRCEKRDDGTPVKDAEGCFKTEYDLAGGAQFQKLMKDNKAVSKGEVLSAGVVSSKGDRVVVLLAVDQTASNANRPSPRVDHTRIQLTLERIDGEWRVVDVAVL
jgi:Mce-associated membrane protein